MKKILLPIILAGSSLICANAQNPKYEDEHEALNMSSNWCHAHSEWDARAEENPQMLLQREVFLKNNKERAAEIYKNQNKTTEPLYVIPVVFHIIHDYGAENISQNQVENAVAFMNRDFRKDNADSVDIVLPFRNYHPDTRIEFRLAKKTPEGKCTEGVTRTASTLTYEGDDQVKDLVRWDNTKYLNIWVVRSIASGAGGYSYTPPVSSAIDGIVVRSGQLSALSHEAGHWLGLNHPWGPNNDSNEPGNCNLDDQIEDTPNTLGQSFCSTGRNSCTDATYVSPEGDTLWVGDVIDNVQNIMDYAFCQAENFTDGQKAFMRATLESSTNGRNNLWTEQNLMETGTNDGFVFTPCPPTADFESNSRLVCQSEQIQFEDYSYGPPVNSLEWIFEGGTPSTSTESNPIIRYDNPGFFKVTLIASNSSLGSDTTVKEQYIEVISTEQSLNTPFAEGFEEQIVFNSSSDSWARENTTSTGWLQTSDASYNGSQSLRVRLNSMPTDATTSVITPYLDLTDSMSCNTLSFRHAYAQATLITNDVFKVFISDDCGQNWELLYFISGAALATNSGLYSFTYKPDPEEWALNEIDLIKYIGDRHVLLKFEVTSAVGSAIYLDDINVGCAPLSAFLSTNEELNVNAKLKAYPNPFNNDITVEIPESAGLSNNELVVWNALGEKVSSMQLSGSSNKINLNNEHFNGAGVYFISVNSTNSNKPTQHIRVIKY